MTWIYAHTALTVWTLLGVLVVALIAAGRAFLSEPDNARQAAEAAERIPNDYEAGALASLVPLPPGLGAGRHRYPAERPAPVAWPLPDEPAGPVGRQPAAGGVERAGLISGLAAAGKLGAALEQAADAILAAPAAPVAVMTALPPPADLVDVSAAAGAFERDLVAAAEFRAIAHQHARMVDRWLVDGGGLGAMPTLPAWDTGQLSLAGLADFTPAAAA